MRWVTLTEVLFAIILGWVLTDAFLPDPLGHGICVEKYDDEPAIEVNPITVRGEYE
jgi:hypothetical protein